MVKKKCVMVLCRGEIKEKKGKNGSVFTCKKCKAKWFEPANKTTLKEMEETLNS